MTLRILVDVAALTSRARASERRHAGRRCALRPSQRQRRADVDAAAGGASVEASGRIGGGAETRCRLKPRRPYQFGSCRSRLPEVWQRIEA